MTKSVFFVLAAIIVPLLIFAISLNRSRPAPQPAEGGKIVLDEGLEIEDIIPGTGPEAQPGKTISVHYTGTFENGITFDSSRARGAPFAFILGAGQVIRGWELGVAGMRSGGIRKLIIPPELAYGAEGVPGAIPPNATLLFEVELIEVK